MSYVSSLASFKYGNSSRKIGFYHALWIPLKVDTVLLSFMRTDGSSIQSISKSVSSKQQLFIYHTEAEKSNGQGKMLCSYTNLVATTYIIALFAPLWNEWKSHSSLVELLKISNYIKHTQHLQNFLTQLARILQRMTYFEFDLFFYFLALGRVKPNVLPFWHFMNGHKIFNLFFYPYSHNLHFFI